jgi:5-methylcytosine-specific restriction endonuclease McrA
MAQKQTQRDWYLRNRETLNAKRKVYNKGIIERNKKFVADYLRDHPCVDCGEDDLVVLDFDHLDPTTKIKEISNLVYNTAGLSTIQVEIAKCEVVCANCHRRRTSKRRG